MMGKHTPGPWEVFRGTIIGHKGAVVVKRRDDFDWVATVQSSNVPEFEANAHLIAVAPELLAELKCLVAQVEAVLKDAKILEEFFELSLAKAVIAKAEGKQ